MTYRVPKNDAQALLKKLGRESVRRALFGPSGSLEWKAREGARSVDQAAWRGVFSARWYEAIKVVCDDRGEVCPMCLFSFRRPPDSSSGMGASAPEGEVA